jgi:hypothetical protein
MISANNRCRMRLGANQSWEGQGCEDRQGQHDDEEFNQGEPAGTVTVEWQMPSTGPGDRPAKL